MSFKILRTAVSGTISETLLHIHTTKEDVKTPTSQIILHVQIHQHPRSSREVGEGPKVQGQPLHFIALSFITRYNQRSHHCEGKCLPAAGHFSQSYRPHTGNGRFLKPLRGERPTRNRTLSFLLHYVKLRTVNEVFKRGSIVQTCTFNKLKVLSHA